MDSQVQEIKDKLSINEVVGNYVKLEKAGRNWRARCPFHKEKTPSFMISPERGSYVCFGCGEKGDIFSFVQKMENIDFKTALQQLAEKAGVVLKTGFVQKPENKEKNEQLYDVCEHATAFFETQLKERNDVLEYLKGRGTTEETVSSWRIGYAPASWHDLAEHLAKLGHTKDLMAEAGLVANSQHKPGEVYDRFRGRIMFPLFDAGGKVIAFSGRFFEKVEGQKDDGGEPAKYVNSPETPLFKKSKVLYGYDRAKNAIRKADCVLLVEGQFDVVLSHQSGLTFAVASSGTAITEEHLHLLSRLSKRLVLALDGDAAGVRAGLKSAAMALKMGFDVKVPTFAGGKDPADLAKEDPELLKTAIRSSKTAVEFFLDALRPAARDERMYKKAIEQQVLPLVAAMESKIEQAHFVRIIAERLRVPEDAIRAEVAKRPALPTEDSVEEPVITQPTHTAVPTQLERAAALLRFYFPTDAGVQEKLAHLVGAERYSLLEQKYKDDAERFKFEFETLGDDHAAIVHALFDAIERATLDEEMSQVRDALHVATPGTEGELVQRLSTLKKRQQELRK